MRRITNFFLIFILLSSSALADTTTGLVGWWKFEEGAGTTAVDSSGSSNNGTLFNSPSRVQGARGMGLSFNGTNQYVSIKDSGGGNNTSDISSQNITIAAWVKINATYGEIICKYDGVQMDASASYRLIWYGNDVGCAGYSNKFYFNVYSGNTPYIRFSSNTFSASSNWIHVVGTYEANSLNLYINGVLNNGSVYRDSCTLAAAPATRNLSSSYTTTVAAINAGSSNFANIAVDDIRIYNRALTAQDVYMLYTNDVKLRGAVLNGLRTSN